MRSLFTLIDEAAALCQSDAELARRLGKHRTQIANMRSGNEPISAETAALLCDLLQLPGDEARRLAALAIVEAPRNASRKEALRRAFFVSWVIGAGLLSNDSNAALTTHRNSLTLSDVYSLYIVPIIRAVLLHVMLKATSGLRLAPTLCRAPP